MDLRLSPVQIRNRLILAARRIVSDHAPDDEGVCPVCGVLHCEALTVALGYLAGVEKPSPIVEIHRPTAVPPPGITGAHLRWDAEWTTDSDRCDGSGPPPARF